MIRVTKPKDHEIAYLARNLQHELDLDAKALAPSVLSEVMADTFKVSKPAFLEHIRANWREAQFRAELFQKIVPQGPVGIPRIENVKAFIELVNEAFEERAPVETLPLQLAEDAALSDDTATIPMQARTHDVVSNVPHGGRPPERPGAQSPSGY